MKSILLVLPLFFSISAHADLRLAVDIGCLAKKYCDVKSYTDYDRHFVQDLNLVTGETIKAYCERMTFKPFRTNAERREDRLGQIEKEFYAGFSCLQPLIPKINSDLSRNQ